MLKQDFKNYISDAELNIVLYIANKVKTKDFHNIFKILFWSDREHLAIYGRKLSDDKYCAPEHGPVPSNLYNYFQSIRDSKDNFFKIDNYSVTPLVSPNLDYISESEIECIDKTIVVYDIPDFNDRKELSHGFAYNNAKKSYNHFINDIDIAIEGGANEELLKFISITT